MTGIARDDHDLTSGRFAERLYKACSRFLLASLLVGPILLGIWFASSAIEEVKPPEPMPAAPKLAPLPKFQSEAEPLPPAAGDPAKLDLASGRAGQAQFH
jgi:hypothetical protein